MSSGLHKKMWYAMVMRQMEGFPRPVVSTIVQPLSNTVWVKEGEDPPQSLSAMDRSEIISQATLHAAQLKDRIVELKHAKWYIEVLEVTPSDIQDIPRIVETITF
jgi:DNA polymerase III delta prime subunit